MASTRWWSVTLLALTWIVTGSAVTPSNKKPVDSNACLSKQTCHDCIQTPNCAWCAMPDFIDKRCFPPHINKIASAECPDNYIIYPINEYSLTRYKELTKNNYAPVEELEEFTITAEIEGKESSSAGVNSETESGGKTSSKTSSASSKQEIVQLYPQEMNVKLRINEAQKIRVEYAQAVDYPVDLYYLMDLSHSMKDDKQKLSDLGVVLAETMSNITSNFRLGFGSFVGTVAIGKEPCDGCAAPYSYKNHMPLSQNTQQFATQVRDASVFVNLNASEGSFDAIMQAIVCHDEIGWRAQARKLLIVSSGASFHHASDGKLGGIVKPNDGYCHLDKNGLYTHSTLQDYASVSQINMKARENSVNIIWAVTEEQIRIYSNLTKVIDGSYAVKLSNDSSSIVDLVRDQYNMISSAIEMTDNSSNDVELTYYSSCLGDGPLVKTEKCEGLKVGDKVEFTVEVRAPSCPEKRSDWNQTFHIYPIGIDESLMVNLELICDCGCERNEPHTEGFEFQSDKCYNHGDLICGICSCHENFFGSMCECDESNGRALTSVNEIPCRKDNTSTVECSGRGSCECNQCICNPRTDPDEIIFGEFCECDNYSCARTNKEICSGKDHGTCVCGQCECLPGWSGNACECDNYSCARTNKEICSGKDHGVCVCGQCECLPGWSGRACEYGTDASH